MESLTRTELAVEAKLGLSPILLRRWRRLLPAALSQFCRGQVQAAWPGFLEESQACAKNDAKSHG